MNLRHLEYFVNVVQQGSIKAAAEQLGVSQPAVSAAVKNLELEFSSQLLGRRREGSVPTQFGKSLYDSAVTVSGVMSNAREQIDALKDPGKGHLKIGVGPSVANDFASAVMGSVLNEFPGCRLDHVVSNSFKNFEQMLIVGEIDIAICHVPESLLPKAINCRLLSDNPIGAFVAAEHFDMDQAVVSMQKVLDEFSWITPRDDEIKAPTGLRLSRYSRDRGIPMSVFADDLKLIRDITLTTRSIGFLPMQTVAKELASGQLVELVVPGASVTRPIYALTRKSDQQIGLLGRFLEEARRYFKRESGPESKHRLIEIAR